MKWNKEKFLKSELGSNLEECLNSWNFWMEMRRSRQNDREVQKGLNWCQAQWEVYEMAFRFFYGKNIYLDTTVAWWGARIEGETDWLIKFVR